MSIIVPKQILKMSPYLGDNLSNGRLLYIYFKEIGPLHHFIGKSPRRRENHFHGYQSTPNANNRTEKDFADEPLFWSKLG